MFELGLFIAFLVGCGVASDARSRGKSWAGAIFWGLGVWLMMILFLPLWLISRPPHPSQAHAKDGRRDRGVELCVDCGKYYEGRAAFCPNCGQVIRRQVAGF